ncbi:MAG TPA: sigma-70 family RNA polymerase sigma factor [Rubrivivax sp.]|nr:sigma-70 family RNA polymerase sigma factor [Rubrivivax sp.]
MNAGPTNPDDPHDASPLPAADDWPAATDDPGDPDEEALQQAQAIDDAADRHAWPVPNETQLVAWITAIVDRDERALAALYDATFTRVFGLVKRIVRSTALAEEVVEDAYFQVWRQAVRFDPARGKALTWLLAMARSRAIDALRREARFGHETADADGPPEAASAQPPHDELLDLARHQARLHQALMRLGAQPRQLVSLSFFRGLSHEEIAQQVGLPVGTVKSQIRRALLALRQALGEHAARPLAS